MTAWPAVLSEQETLDLVLNGRSLARYGDGELHLCAGGRAKAQAHDAGLQRRLQGILRNSGHCLVGLPNLRADTPKAAFWQPFHGYHRLLAERPYCSAFVTRPDSAPWIDTPEYWARLSTLWLGRDVTLVRGGRHGLSRTDLVGAGMVTEIAGPAVNAWASYGALLERIGTPKLALLCMGPTATVLAVDLCAHGVQAVDLGHVGLFLRKHRRGEPMTVTAEDRAA